MQLSQKTDLSLKVYAPNRSRMAANHLSLLARDRSTEIAAALPRINRACTQSLNRGLGRQPGHVSIPVHIPYWRPLFSSTRSQKQSA